MIEYKGGLRPPKTMLSGGGHSEGGLRPGGASPCRGGGGPPPPCPPTSSPLPGLRPPPNMSRDAPARQAPAPAPLYLFAQEKNLNNEHKLLQFI